MNENESESRSYLCTRDVALIYTCLHLLDSVAMDCEK